jgi:hypothetical protein
VEHGGRRPGAGRRKGAPNRSSARREQFIAQSGPTPLDALIRVYRYYLEMAEQELQRKRPNEARVNAAFARVADVASKAANFVHPRLAAVDHRPQFDLNLLKESEQEDVVRLLIKADPTGNAARIADTPETGEH